MKTLGIICEYNPFHKGHEYQINKAKELSGADAVVCVMSGSFVQRGDVSVFDKFTRANSAVFSGADLVVELPAAYSLSCAENFAKGGISILNALGADYIAFGAECGNLKKLSDVSDALLNETAEFKEVLSQNLKKGLSYQASRDISLKEVFNVDSSVLKKPNNALAVEYLKSIKKTNSSLECILIKRKGKGYNDKTLSEDSFSSATAIREAIKENGINTDLKTHIPEKALFVYETALKSGISPVFLSDLNDIIMYRLRTISKEEFKNINDVSEGIENRIIDGARKFSDVSDVIDYASGKRYTKSRISRIILNALLSVTKNDLTDINYIRVLSMSEVGSKLLKEKKNSCPVPIITKLASFNKDEFKLLKFDLLANDIYSLFSSESKKAGEDFTRSPAVIKRGEVHYVYILRLKDDTLYTGWTNNLEKRVKDHNLGKGAKYTKGRGPAKLVYHETYPDKISAQKREREIKLLSREEKLKLIDGFLVKDN